MEMFIAFNFSRATILDFMTSLRCPIVSNKRIGTFRLGYEYEIEYEYDFSILVFRLHIITTHTHFIP